MATKRTCWSPGSTMAGCLIGLVLCSLLLLPGTAAGQEPTPLREWQRLYNSLAIEAGLAVVALADDPDPFTFVEAEQRLIDLADGLEGVVPDPCYQAVHDYARLAASSLLVGIRIARDGWGSGLGVDDGPDLHRLALRDLSTAANDQLRFPNAQIIAWVGESCAASESTSADGASTPEAVVRTYLSGVADADLEAIFAVTAVDAYGDGFRFDQLVDWRRAFTPTLDPSPPDHALYRELNRLMQEEAIGRKVTLLVYSLLSSEHRSDQGIGPWPIRVDDESWAPSFAAEVDPSRAAHLEIADIRFPDASLEDHPRWLESAERLARILGADDLTQRLALVSLDDQLFDVGFTLVRYGDVWKVLDQTASLGNTDSWGAAHPTTLEDFEARTSGEASGS